jgi:redox-sensitive bicupin YhaK (pirin superfamily)
MAESVPAIEGAGVRLRRAFGNLQGVNLDPFLLLDEMHSNDPKDTAPGFPWHPHRGIDTFTVMIEGAMAHGDSLGNSGLLKPGDLQYMTGGSGIIHQEMPQPEINGYLRGLQLWVNLPRSHKMMQPRYQEIKASEVNSVKVDGGINDIDVRVLAGEFQGVHGPVDEVPTQPRILDVRMDHETTLVDQTPSDHTMVAYVLDGHGNFEDNDRLDVKAGNLIVFNTGDEVRVQSHDEPLHFLMFSGKPIREPVAWAGPVVMNTDEELQQAFAEMRSGHFIKHEYRI